MDMELSNHHHHTIPAQAGNHGPEDPFIITTPYQEIISHLELESITGPTLQMLAASHARWCAKRPLHLHLAQWNRLSP